MDTTGFSRTFALIAWLFLRISVLLLAQTAIALALSSWQDSMTWWPFSILAANLFCLAVMLHQTRAAGESFWETQSKPFDSTLPLGMLSGIFQLRHAESRPHSLVHDAILFLSLVVLLGIPAIALKE